MVYRDFVAEPFRSVSRPAARRLRGKGRGRRHHQLSAAQHGVIRVRDLQAYTYAAAFLCFFKDRDSASLMRLCQPLPSALKASTISASRRSVTCTFGCSSLGRPRFNDAAKSGIASRKRRARAKSASVHSGLSGSAVLFLLSSDFFRIFPCLMSGCLAKAYNPQLFCRCREHQRVQRDADEPERAVAHLAVENIVRNEDGAVPVETLDSCEIHAMLAQIARALGFVPDDPHMIYCSYSKLSVNDDTAW